MSLTERAKEKEKNERLEDKAKSDILMDGSSGRLQTSINLKPSPATLVSGCLHQGKAINQRRIGARFGSLLYPNG